MFATRTYVCSTSNTANIYMLRENEMLKLQVCNNFQKGIMAYPLPPSNELQPSSSMEVDSAEDALEEEADTTEPMKNDETSFVRLARLFQLSTISHEISDLAAGTLWSFMGNNAELIAKVSKQQDKFPSFKTAQRSLNNIGVPRIKMEACWFDYVTRVPHVMSDLVAIPRKPPTFKLQYEIAKVDIKELYNLHKKMCPEQIEGKTRVTLSVDGVVENHSSGVSLEIYSIKFGKCRNIYPVVIYRPHRGRTVKGYKYLELLMPIINQVLANGMKLDLIVCDAPVRAKIRRFLNHNGYFGCEYCYAKGEFSGGVRWPFHGSKGMKLRTSKQTAAIAKRAQREKFKKVKITDKRDLFQGVKSHSPLLDVPGFDLIRDIPVEYMHNFCLGVYKQAFKATFEFADEPHSKKSIKMKKNSLSEFDVPKLHSIAGLNEKVWATRLPSDFSRRSRDVIPTYTAEEWRMLGIVLFPLVVEAISSEDKKEIFLLLAYIMRAYISDDDTYKRLVSILQTIYITRKRHVFYS